MSYCSVSFFPLRYEGCRRVWRHISDALLRRRLSWLCLESEKLTVRTWRASYFFVRLGHAWLGGMFTGYPHTGMNQEQHSIWPPDARSCPPALFPTHFNPFPCAICLCPPFPSPQPTISTHSFAPTTSAGSGQKCSALEDQVHVQLLWREPQQRSVQCGQVRWNMWRGAHQHELHAAWAPRHLLPGQKGFQGWQSRPRQSHQPIEGRRRRPAERCKLLCLQLRLLKVLAEGSALEVSWIQ